MSSFKMFGTDDWYEPLGVSYEFDEGELGFMIPGMGSTWLAREDVVELHKHLTEILDKD